MASSAVTTSLGEPAGGEADRGDVVGADVPGGEHGPELGEPVGGAGGDHHPAGGGRVEVSVRR